MIHTRLELNKRFGYGYQARMIMESIPDIPLL